MNDVAMSGVMAGRCQLIIAAKGCYKCGVGFSEGWTEKKIQLVVEGRRHQLGVPICAGCAPFARPLPMPPPRGRSV